MTKPSMAPLLPVVVLEITVARVFADRTNHRAESCSLWFFTSPIINRRPRIENRKVS